MHTTVFGGPPAAVMALFSSATVSMETYRAAGCTLKTTTLPAESMQMVLQMIVATGFVVGVMAPMTPYGAYSTSVRPCSPVNARVRRPSVPTLFSMASAFLATLSSKRP